MEGESPPLLGTIAPLDDEARHRVRGIFQHAVARGHQNPQGVKGSDVTPRPTDWLWYPYFPAGEVVLVGGSGDMGKGQALASLAARLSRRPKKGQKKIWPGGERNEHVGHVLWAEAEDSIPKTVLPRLMANKANLENITFLGEENFRAPYLGQLIEEHDTRMIVLSPIVSFLPKLRSPNDELKVRTALKELHDAVQDTSCAIVGIVHLNKKTDLDAIERVLGSMAFTNFVRSVILINLDEDHEGKRRWLHAKHNLAIRGDDLLFGMVHVGSDERDQYVKVRWTRTLSPLLKRQRAVIAECPLRTRANKGGCGPGI